MNSKMSIAASVLATAIVCPLVVFACSSDDPAPAAKTEDGEAAAGGAPDKKARAAKVKDTGEKWEPDGQ